MAAICLGAGASSDCAVCSAIADGAFNCVVWAADSPATAIGASSGFTRDVAAATMGARGSCLTGAEGGVVLMADCEGSVGGGGGGVGGSVSTGGRGRSEGDGVM